MMTSFFCAAFCHRFLSSFVTFNQQMLGVNILLLIAAFFFSSFCCLYPFRFFIFIIIIPFLAFHGFIIVPATLLSILLWPNCELGA